MHLPPGIIAHVASFLPPGEAAYNLRVACKAFASDVSAKNLLTIPIGDGRPPVLPHALLARWGRSGSSRGLTYKQRVQLLVDAARGGDVDALAQLSRATGCLVNEEVFRAAARAGQERVCDWLLEQECSLALDGGCVLAAAAEAGHTQLCKALHHAGFTVLDFGARLAARAGHGHTVSWVVKNRANIRPTFDQIEDAGMPEGLYFRPWANAAYGGHVALAEELKGSIQATPDDLQAVAYGCPLAVLCKLFAEGMRNSSLGMADIGLEEKPIMAGAVSSPTPDWRDKVTWLRQVQKFSVIYGLGPYMAQDFAALPDAMQRLDWLAGQGFGLRACRDLLGAAVEAGRAELVSKMSFRYETTQEEPELGPSLAQLVDLAVRKGHLGIAKELRGRGAPVDTDYLAYAAGGTGRVDVVQWVLQVIREEEDKEAQAEMAETSTAAAEDGVGAPAGPQQQEQQQGARDRGGVTGPGQESGTSSGAEASGGVQTEEREVIRVTEDVLTLWELAIQSGSLEVVRWLHERGVGWDSFQLGFAAKSGNELLVEWMVERGYDMDKVGWVGLG